MAICGQVQSGYQLANQSMFENAIEDLQTISDAANSELPTAPARLAGTVRTLQGRLAEISGFLMINGGVWAAGVEFNGYDEYMVYNQTAYKVRSVASIPITSGAAPDSNFEPFSIAISGGQVLEQITEFAEEGLGDYTDYVFFSVADMQVGEVLGGQTVDFKAGQALKVQGTGVDVSFYSVVTSAPGLPIAGGYYAREVYAKVADESGTGISPLSTLDPSKDANRNPQPATSLVDATPATSADEFASGVLSHQNKIYCVPNFGTTVLKIDPSTKTVSEIGSVAGSQGYSSAALAANGIIYAVSTGDDNILRIDPIADSVTEISGLSGTNYGFDGIVAADDGMLYFVPASATRAVRFNPATNSVNYIGATYSADPGKWAGGCVAPNGRIYCAPFDADTILEINPVTGNTRTIATTSSAAFGRWKGCVLGQNGLIYFIPFNADKVMTYNYQNDSVEYLSSTITGSDKFFGGVVGFNSRIYCAPYSAEYVLEINTQTGATAQIGFPAMASTSKCAGFVQDMNGVIFGSPSNEIGKMLVLSGLAGSNKWQLSAYANKY